MMVADGSGHEKSWSQKHVHEMLVMVVVVNSALSVVLACHQQGFRGHHHIQSMSSQNHDLVGRNNQVVQF